MPSTAEPRAFVESNGASSRSLQPTLPPTNIELIGAPPPGPNLVWPDRRRTELKHPGMLRTRDSVVAYLTRKPFSNAELHTENDCVSANNRTRLFLQYRLVETENKSDFSEIKMPKPLSGAHL